MRETDSASRVQAYFHRSSVAWDEIYSFEGGSVYRWLNRRLRKGVYNRAARVLEVVTAERRDLRSLLDIGCGSGRIALQVAELGIAVTGIDFAQNMVDLAAASARRAAIPSVSFHVGDFRTYDFGNRSFDVAIAMGVLDYNADAPGFIRKLRSVTGRLALVTFPVKGTPRSHVRRLRLALKGCPVYYYTPADIDAIYRASGFSSWSVERMNNMYFVGARV
jgi:ubiquinone/menaquinone biosynthesis C-methylase UbiE